MNPDSSYQEEKRLAELFAAATDSMSESQAPPPDAELLARLREESTEVFAAQFSPQPSPPRGENGCLPLLCVPWPPP